MAAQKHSNVNGAPALWRAMQIEAAYLSEFDHLWSRVTYLGAEAALRSAGILAPDDSLPRKPTGLTDPGRLQDHHAC